MSEDVKKEEVKKEENCDCGYDEDCDCQEEFESKCCFGKKCRRFIIIASAAAVGVIAATILIKLIRK